MGDSRSDNIQFCSFSILEKRVLQTLILGLCPTSILKFILGDWGAVSWVTKNWQQKFSITGKKAPGILLLMNQFHNLFAVFMIFLYEEVHPQTRLLAVPVWLVQDSFLREEFLVKWDPRNQRNSIIGKISV